jgi:hypothetical protein
MRLALFCCGFWFLRQQAGDRYRRRREHWQADPLAETEPLAEAGHQRGGDRWRSRGLPATLRTATSRAATTRASTPTATSELRGLRCRVAVRARRSTPPAPVGPRPVRGTVVQAGGFFANKLLSGWAAVLRRAGRSNPLAPQISSTCPRAARTANATPRTRPSPLQRVTRSDLVGDLVWRSSERDRRNAVTRAQR